MTDCYNLLKTVQEELLITAASVAAYRRDDVYARSSLKTVWENSAYRPLRPQRPFVTIEDLLTLEEDERKILGFHNWDDDLVLVPLWAFNYIADGETLTSISGQSSLKGTDKIDLDHRYGCVAFGFKTR